MVATPITPSRICCGQPVSWADLVLVAIHFQASLKLPVPSLLATANLPAAPLINLQLLTVVVVRRKPIRLPKSTNNREVKVHQLQKMARPEPATRIEETESRPLTMTLPLAMIPVSSLSIHVYFTILSYYSSSLWSR